MMPSLSYSDLNSALISSIRAGAFDDLIREALPTGPEERKALQRYLQRQVTADVLPAMIEDGAATEGDTFAEVFVREV